jgi:hypothetical protein
MMVDSGVQIADVTKVFHIGCAEHGQIRWWMGSVSDSLDFLVSATHAVL